jgi:ankyrin repeat protein
MAISTLSNFLLESGVDVNMRDDDNKAPLRLANGNGKHKIAMLLAEHMRKGGVDSWNEMDITTLDRTPQNTYSDIVAL